MVFISMLTFRAVTTAVIIVVFGWTAFQLTPELDGVRRAWFYRLLLSALRIWFARFLLFEVFGLFPME